MAGKRQKCGYCEFIGRQFWFNSLAAGFHTKWILIPDIEGWDVCPHPSQQEHLQALTMGSFYLRVPHTSPHIFTPPGGLPMV